MTETVLITTLEDAIIETFCQFEIIENEKLQHLVAKTPEGHIDIDKTFQNALENLDYHHIYDQINWHCYPQAVIDHWQQTAPDIIDESDISDEEFNELITTNSIYNFLDAAMNNIIDSLENYFDR